MNKETNLIYIPEENNCNYARYKGVVTVSLFHKDKLLKTVTSHNEGLENLFMFVSKCLAGRWAEAQESRPCKLVLLEKDERESFEGSTRSTPLTDTEETGYWTSKYAISTPMVYDNAALNATTPTSGSVTYHFRIPSLALTAGKKIKKLLLLPSLYTSYSKDACAYFILEGEGLEDGITIPEQGGNTTVIIDWTLIFTNEGEH